MSILRKGSFEPPKRASASHLIHLIGIDQFREELAKQQKAKAAGILEVITATSISRNATISKREQEMLDVAHQMHQNGQINDLAWAQIKAIFVYIGADKDQKDCLIQKTINFPEDWEPGQDLNFAKRLLPKFLSYQLQDYKELGQSIDIILEKAGLLNQPEQKELTPEEKFAAEELAHWEKIKNSIDKSDFQKHFKYYKGGAHSKLAYNRLEELTWHEIGKFPSYNSLLAFLESFPYGKYAEEARKKLKELADKIQKQHYSTDNKDDKKKKKNTAGATKKQSGSLKSSAFSDFLKSLWQSSAHDRNSITSNSIALSEIKKHSTSNSAPPGNRRSVLLSLAAGTVLSVGAVAMLTKNSTTLQQIDDSVKTFTGHSKSLKTVAFLPNGQQVLSGSADRTLKLWDINTGQEIRTFVGHGDIVNSVAVSPDGRTALSASHDKTLKLWDLQTGELLNTLSGHENSVVSVAFSKDGHLALSGSHDKTLKLWHISSGKLLRTFIGHRDWVVAVAFIEGTNAVLSASHDKTMKLWDMGTGRNVRTFEGHKDWVTSIAASRNNFVALSGSLDETLKLWNMNTGETIKTFKNLSKSAIASISMTPDERTALLSSYDNSLVLWDIESGKKLKTFYGHKTSRANAVTISPDGNFALSAGEDNTLKLWKLRDKNS